MLHYPVNIALTDGLEAWHQAITTTYQSGHDLLRFAAVEPVVIGQIGEAVTTLGVRAMTHCAVVEVDTFGHLHGFGVLRQFGNRDLLVLGKNRSETLLGACDFLLPLSFLGPAEYPGEVAQARVEHKVAQSKNHDTDIELVPPA